MPYTSPFRLLDLGADATLDKSTINLAKKKILAELDLSSSQTIVLAGQEMTKNDVLQFFDVLGKTKNLEYHQAIAKDSVLLSFLEKGIIEKNASFLQQAIYNNSDFIDFVSPYFSEKYSDAIIEALRESNNKDIAQYLSLNPILLSPSDKYKAWEQIESFLIGEIKGIDTAAEEAEAKGIKTREEVMHFYDYQFLGCLNRLPEDFASTRDRYARALYSLATVQWNKGAHKNAAEIIKETMLLNTYPETQTLLKDRTTWFNEQLNKVASSSSSSSNSDSNSNGWSSLWYIFIFIVSMLRLASTCNRINRTSSDNSSRVVYDSKLVEPESYNYGVEPPKEDGVTAQHPTQIWVDSYLEKEKKKLYKLYLSEKKEKKLIRQLAKNQAALYEKVNGTRNILELNLLARAISKNLVWLYNYGNSSDSYIEKMADWFEAEVRLGAEHTAKFPKEK